MSKQGRKQTSSRVSSAAARLLAKLPKGGRVDVYEPSSFYVHHSFAVSTLRSLLMSLIGQDETPGQVKPNGRKKRKGARR